MPVEERLLRTDQWGTGRGVNASGWQLESAHPVVEGFAIFLEGELLVTGYAQVVHLVQAASSVTLVTVATLTWTGFQERAGIAT